MIHKAQKTPENIDFINEAQERATVITGGTN